MIIDTKYSRRDIFLARECKICPQFGHEISELYIVFIIPTSVRGGLFSSRAFINSRYFNDDIEVKTRDGVLGIIQLFTSVEERLLELKGAGWTIYFLKEGDLGTPAFWGAIAGQSEKGIRSVYSKGDHCRLVADGRFDTPSFRVAVGGQNPFLALFKVTKDGRDVIGPSCNRDQAEQDGPEITAKKLGENMLLGCPGGVKLLRLQGGDEEGEAWMERARARRKQRRKPEEAILVRTCNIRPKGAEKPEALSIHFFRPEQDQVSETSAVVRSRDYLHTSRAVGEDDVQAFVILLQMLKSLLHQRQRDEGCEIWWRALGDLVSDHFWGGAAGFWEVAPGDCDEGTVEQAERFLTPSHRVAISDKGAIATFRITTDGSETFLSAITAEEALSYDPEALCVRLGRGVLLDSLVGRTFLYEP